MFTRILCAGAALAFAALPQPTASAEPGCVVAGTTVSTWEPLYFSPPRETTFGFMSSCGYVEIWFPDATCLSGNGSGVVHAWPRDWQFTVRWVGTSWVFSGGATGVIEVIPAPGESCVNPGPGADRFTLTGAFELIARER